MVDILRDGAMRILAVDVGTSFVKAAVLEVGSLAPVGSVERVEYAVDRPTAEAAEVPAERLWQAVSAAGRAATRSADGVEAIGLCCFAPGLVLLDQGDRALGPIWMPLDRRSRSPARQMWQSVGPEFLATVGCRPLPGGISALSWRQQLDDDPYLGHRVRCYLHVNGWLGLRLTGEKGCDPSNASLSGLFATLTDRQWSPRWCEYFRVDPCWLPTVACGSTTIGALRSDAAAQLGASAGIPVKLGTTDTSSAVLAAGMKPGDLLHQVGATDVLAALTPQPSPHPRRRTQLLGVANDYLHVADNPVSGAALPWIRQLCFRDQSDAEFYERTIPACLEADTRVTLDPPFLGGDPLEIEARYAAFRDLSLTTDRLELLKAVLQAMRRCQREAVQNLGLKEPVRRCFLAGGAANIIQRIIPEYGSAAVHHIEDASLRGVARLFQMTPA